MGGWMAGGMWGWMLFGSVFWILILVGLGFLVYALVTRLGEPWRRDPPMQDDPIAVARIRYARGELTREEFRQIQHDLDDRGGTQS